ncbi:MAG: ANL family adenylate-forming protein [Bdellovibrionales bacterium]
MNWRALFEEMASAPALWEKGAELSYRVLMEKIDANCEFLKREIPEGRIVHLESDFSADALAMWFALCELGHIIVPFTGGTEFQRQKQMTTAEANARLHWRSGEWVLEKNGVTPSHPLLLTLLQKGRPGLLLFTSGSSGEAKALLHDLSRLFLKFKNAKPNAMRTVQFLLFDHIGGINTFLATFAAGGTLILLENRGPEHVTQVIRASAAEILPTTPTFLNLWLLANDIAVPSLKKITYGTERISDSLLAVLRERLPQIQLKQTYGVSEVGILSTRTPTSDSPFLEFSNSETQIRVVDGGLEIKSQTAMLGYLNAPSPFTADGWFKTGDLVELNEQGAMRILGRPNDLINIGGRKVFPAEIESCLREMPGVEQVVVEKEDNLLLGQVAVAFFKLKGEMSLDELLLSMRRFCEGRLESFMIPQRVVISSLDLYSSRYKRMKMGSDAESGNSV